MFNGGVRPAMNAGYFGISCRWCSANQDHSKNSQVVFSTALAQYRELAAFSQFASDLG